VSKQPSAQLDIDAVGRVRKQVGPQDPQHGLEHTYPDKPDDEHIERAHAAVHEHLIDDDLEEEGRDEGEHLEKKRCNEHLAQQVSVFVDGA